jgi:serine/threonine protein kinase
MCDPPMERLHSDRATYEFSEFLGEGTYSLVWKARCRKYKQNVAIKLIPRNLYREEKLREVEILESMHHENVIPLLDHGICSDWMYLVFPIFPISLEKYFAIKRKNNSQLSPRVIHKLVKQLFKSLAYIHGRNLIHRDIKPANILLTHEAKLIIIDFGISTTVEAVKNHTDTLKANTLWYRPVEVLLGQTDYSQSVDIWAAACCIVEMFDKIPLFPEYSEIGMLFNIFKIFGTPTESPTIYLPHFNNSFPKWPANKLVRPPFNQLLHECFDYNPNTRITASQVLKIFF